MDTALLKQVMDWVRSTDLADVSFKDGKHGFSFQSASASTRAETHFFQGRPMITVVADCVGLFQWNEPGKPRAAEEGASVEDGTLLGIVDTGLKKTVPIKASCAGRLSRILIEAGALVQYGQPLFIIEPR